MIKKLLFVVIGVLAIVFVSITSALVSPIQNSHSAEAEEPPASINVSWPIEPEKDTFTWRKQPYQNAGWIYDLEVSGNNPPYVEPAYILLEFNISALPENAVIKSAVLSMHLNNMCHDHPGYYSGCEIAPGHPPLELIVVKQPHTDWSESEANWYEYKAGSSWTNMGGDRIFSNPSHSVAYIQPGQGVNRWIDWNVTDIVLDAQDLSIPVEFIMMTIEPTWFTFSSRECGQTICDSSGCVTYFNAEDRPKLIINYEVPLAETPLIYVHGYMSDANGSTDMFMWLENNSYMQGLGYIRDENLFAISLSHDLIYDKATKDIVGYAGELSRFIADVKSKTGVEEVDLVCHSMGGLVARWYTRSNCYHNDVRNLIMIGVPNHGIPVAAFSFVLNPISLDYLGVAAEEMTSLSPFLIALNYGGLPPCYDCINPNIHHETIAGTVGWLATQILDIISFCTILGCPNDGLVAESSVRLYGVNLQEVPYNHTDQVKEPETFQMVLDILKADATYANNVAQQTLTLAQTEQDNITSQQLNIQQVPEISARIFTGEQKSHEITVSAASNASVALLWQSGDLDLTLITPDGTVITSSVIIGDSNITYHYDSETTIKGYTISNPESGVWQVNISAIDIPAEGTDYTILTFLETTLNLSLDLAKYQYDPGEQINVIAGLENGSTPITGALVSAEILRPNETVDSLALYDDGLHNDGDANDGIYADAYTNTTIWGMYKITVSASSTDNGAAFARQSVAAVWAEYYTDLTLSSSDISFSDDTPVSGENITISAIISNIGEANAGNVSILFFDGAPADDVLLGEDVIDVNTSQTANAFISWNATGGHHEIHVVISPYNGFLQKDYTNDEASKNIDVPCALIISSSEGGNVTTPGEGTFGPYSPGETVNLIATPDAYYHFVNWAGNTSTITDVNASSTTITMNGDYMIQANFAIDTYLLMTSSSEGGNVTTPGEIGPYTYNCSAVASIIATADPWYQFVNWTGSGVDASKVADPNSASTTITMDGNYSVQANFTPKSGTGTASDPYIVRTVEDLQNINLNLSAYYELGNDIDASATRNWNNGAGFIPIGNVDTIMGFSGSLDGKRYTITGLYQYTVDSPALVFSNIGPGGIVKNIDFSDLSVTSTGNQSIACLCYANFGSISNCSLSGVFTAQMAIGFCVMNGGSINNCYSTAICDGIYSVGFLGMGGVFGLGTDGDITNCYFSGALIGLNVSGFCLDNHSFGGNAIVSCYWDTEVSGASTSDGGEGKTTAEMKQQATFVGWDFATPVWHIVEGVTYPTFNSSASSSYTLTTSSSSGGTVTAPGIGNFSYQTDEIVSLVATPDSCYHFVNWTSSCVDADKVVNPNVSSTTILMDADYSVQANFAIDTYTLTYNVGAGGSINGTSHQTVNCGADGTDVTAVPDTCYHFVDWNDGLTTASRTDTNITDDVTVTANFAIDIYTLTISNSTGGTVTAPGIGAFTRNCGEAVAITAAADNGYRFTNWSGDTGSIANISAANTTIVMDEAKTVQANFIPLIQTTTYTFTTGGGINKWCSEGQVYLVNWNNGHPTSPTDFANSYGYVSGGTSAYSAVSSSDNMRWRSDISRCLGCCAFDRNAELFTFNIAEDSATISNIQIKWEGHGTIGETIYYTTEKLWNAAGNSWSTLNNKKNITGDITWTNNISSGCSNYIDASGNLNILLAAQRSGLPWNCGIWTDYIEVTVTH